MRNQFRQIRIQPEALSLIERILASCIDMDKTNADIRFDHEQTVTLEDLRNRFPIPAIGLYQVCVANQSSAVNQWDVIQLFAGPIHVQAVKDRLENPNQIIVATGQPFLARMKEVGIHFSIPENQAAFGLLDLAMPARIEDCRGRKCHLRIWNVALINAVVPTGLRFEKGQWVLTHMGAVIAELSEPQVTEIRRLQKGGAGRELISEFTTVLRNTTVNCENFCPSTPSKKDGCNLTVWNLERL
jgi:hydrogenase maturation factor